ncbi:hypothetical protein PV08_10650 [Exophiala spinifera]|uniref:Ribonuclease T2-like n=1 Tax=Exophiala spinifera TaxID=91928 RepID=A0A0D2AY46_9EURO|nr:uncharacterized protein PV08_10650 [Exophiala spinifera]KIW11350.1 hypothetical protein PV08_10650 [Exophiala spinifera]
MAPSLIQLPFISSLLHLLPGTPPETTSTAISTTTVQSCPNPPSLSCPFPPPREINTCCVNHPSGHFLQTQFWDTSPALGPNTSWTIHGLWPDLCTGGFDEFCDSTRSHPPGAMRELITTLLNHTHSDSSTALLDFMDEYWLSLNSDPAHLWAHEWNKHGTCVSTLEPGCYPEEALSGDHVSEGDGSGTITGGGSSSIGGDSGGDLDLGILDYFIHTTSLFRTLDTHAILSEAGIVPSRDVRYTLQDLEDAVSSSPHGHAVTFRCTHSGELNEIWYHFSVKGPLRNAYARDDDALATTTTTTSSSPAPPHQHHLHDSNSLPFLPAETVREIFVPTDPDGAKSNCPASGIKYLPKNDKSPDNPGPSPPTRTSTVTATSTPTSTSPPFTGKGHLAIHVLDDASSLTSTSISATHDDSAADDSVRAPAAQNQKSLAAPVAPRAPSSLSENPPSDQNLGCLIRLGQWYVSGTCATFTAQSDVVDPGHAPLFSLSSSYSPCLIDRATARFECTKSTSVQSIFSSDPQNPHVLSYQNKTTFYADHVPKRFDKVDVYADDADGARSVRLEIHWIPT